MAWVRHATRSATGSFRSEASLTEVYVLAEIIANLNRLRVEHYPAHHQLRRHTSVPTAELLHRPNEVYFRNIAL